MNCNNEVSKTPLKFDRLRQNAINNFENFKAEQLNSKTEVVFNNAYKVTAYEALRDFLQESNDYLPEEQIEFLVSKGEKVVDFLFHNLAQTILNPSCADDVCQIIDDTYSEYIEEKNEVQNEL